MGLPLGLPPLPGLPPLSGFTLGFSPLPMGLAPSVSLSLVTPVGLVTRSVPVEGRVVVTCVPLSVVRGATVVTRSLEVLWLTVPLPLLMPEGRVVAPLLLPLLVVVVAGRLVVGLLTWVLVVLVGRVVIVVVTLFEPELLWLTVLLPILEPVGREVELLLVVVVAGRLVAGLLT